MNIKSVESVCIKESPKPSPCSLPQISPQPNPLNPPQTMQERLYSDSHIFNFYDVGEIKRAFDSCIKSARLLSPLSRSAGAERGQMVLMSQPVKACDTLGGRALLLFAPGAPQRATKKSFCTQKLIISSSSSTPHWFFVFSSGVSNGHAHPASVNLVSLSPKRDEIFRGSGDGGEPGAIAPMPQAAWASFPVRDAIFQASLSLGRCA